MIQKKKKKITQAPHHHAITRHRKIDSSDTVCSNFVVEVKKKTYYKLRCIHCFRVFYYYFSYITFDAHLPNGSL